MGTHDLKRPEYKGPFSIDNREQGSHARGVYPTQDSSRMGTASVKQEEETDKNKRVVRNLEERKVGTKGKSAKQGLTSAKDPTTELSEGREVILP